MSDCWTPSAAGDSALLGGGGPKGGGLLPDGMLPPVQALTMGFVHDEVLHQPALGAIAAPFVATDANGLVAPALAFVGGAGTASVPVPPIAPGVEAAAVLAQGLAGQQAGQAALAPLAGAASATEHSRQGIRIGGLGVMLSYEDGSELTEMPDLYYLPNAPVWVKGLANLHGNLVPVFDVAEYLGIDKEDGSPASDWRDSDKDKTMLLVLGHGLDAAGVLIKGIPVRLTPLACRQTDMDTAPALLLPHIQGAYFMNEQLWFDLDCGSLLDALEQAMLPQA